MSAALKEFVTSGAEFLIIWSPPFFVQFAGVYPDRAVADSERRSFFIRLYEDSGLYAEATSDQFLEPDVRVGQVGGSRLSELGWAAPSRATPNWSRDFVVAGEESLDGVAHAVLQTFEVFGAQGPFTFEFGDPV